MRYDHYRGRKASKGSVDLNTGLLWRGIILSDTQTVGSASLDEGSARRRRLYLTALTTDRHPCLRRDSVPQYQQAKTLRPSGYFTYH